MGKLHVDTLVYPCETKRHWHDCPYEKYQVLCDEFAVIDSWFYTQTQAEKYIECITPLSSWDIPQIQTMAPEGMKEFRKKLFEARDEVLWEYPRFKKETIERDLYLYLQMIAGRENDSVQGSQEYCEAYREELLSYLVTTPQ